MSEPNRHLFSKACIAGLLLAGSTIASAQQTAADALVAFARCDASLFELLGNQPGLLGPSVETEQRGAVAAPKVIDRFPTRGSRTSGADCHG